MTVCIGAICADEDGDAGKAVVIASDRMVSWGPTEFEHEVPKIKHITDRIVSLSAGDALRGSTLAVAVSAELPSGVNSVQAAAEVAGRLYGEMRRAQLASEIFRPRGIDMEQFYRGQQTQMVPMIAGQMDGQAVQYDFGLECLVAGVDDDGGHLFVITNPGDSSMNFEPIGFAAVGSGAIHAIQSMIGFAHTGSRDLHETVFRVYASKKRAEAAPGVGNDTDVGVITNKGARYLSADALKQLNDLYAEFQQPVLKDIKAKVSKIQIVDGGAANVT